MIHINFTCDEPECTMAQSVGFEDHSETYGDLIRLMSSVGWQITGGPDQPDVRCKCPKHIITVCSAHQVYDPQCSTCQVTAEPC